MFVSYSLVLLIFWLHGGSSSSLVSSCTGGNVESWNTDKVAEKIESWIKSGKTVDGEGKIQSRLFHQHSGVFQHHFYHKNDGRFDDVNTEFKSEFKSVEEFKNHDKIITIGDFYNDKNIDIDDDEQEEETASKYGHLEDFDYELFNENDRSVVTIGEFSKGIPTGLVWQRRSRRFEDGFLYGEVDNKGKFTGEDITFIYPDLKTGIRGTFINGYLISGLEVKITAERCNGGIKELRIETVEKRRGIVWKRENLNDTYPGKHPTVRDPFERRNVYIEESVLGRSYVGSIEGVFAKRNFSSGQLVMYLSGLKLQSSERFSPGMSRKEQEEKQEQIKESNFLKESGADYFEWSSWFGFPGLFCIDFNKMVWDDLTVKQYRTTLGHKIHFHNKGINLDWGFVRHPIHGPVISLVANQPISKGQELVVIYSFEECMFLCDHECRADQE